jgi:hypothetical protein
MKPQKKDWPCNGCTRRHPGCHGSCVDYLEAKARTVVRAAKKAEIGMLNAYTVDQIRKTKGKAGGLIKNCRPKGAR